VASAATGILDGRQLRSARSRRAICEACLDLVQEGVLQPSADQVADRAGLSRRSIFNHFGDLAELYDAVVEAGMRRCAPLLEEVPASGPVTRRVAELVRVRSRFLEACAAFTRSLTAQALVGPAADQATRVWREALRLQHREVENLFERELRQLPAGERAEVLEALSAALSPLQWEYLRRSRGHSAERARAVLRRTLLAILEGAAPR
jgi:TetR/AcrR family transcriptional regulator of autoinduction and epiphytic fitness